MSVRVATICMVMGTRSDEKTRIGDVQDSLGLVRNAMYIPVGCVNLGLHGCGRKCMRRFIPVGCDHLGLRKRNVFQEVVFIWAF